jgi:hypothetical protein
MRWQNNSVQSKKRAVTDRQETFSFIVFRENHSVQNSYSYHIRVRKETLKLLMQKGHLCVGNTNADFMVDEKETAWTR